MTRHGEPARLDGLPEAAARMAEALEKHQGQEHYDVTPWWRADWAAAVDRSLPTNGLGSEAVLDTLAEVVVPHSIPSDAGGFTGWVFTSPPVVPTVARLVTSRVGAQRYLGFATALCEQVALRWLARVCGVPSSYTGVFTSGGSAANLVGLSAARQWAYERAGADPARDGLSGVPEGRVYGSTDVHYCLYKNAAILGLGRDAVRLVETDDQLRMSVPALRRAIVEDLAADRLPIAVVASAGSVHTGAIDPIAKIADLCGELGMWLHVDGAYGLPGVLDDRIAERYAGLERADSMAADPHKWLAVPTGVGAAYVRDEGILGRAFTATPSAYIEGQFAGSRDAAESAWDWMGPDYADWSVELTAPAVGVIVWAALAEIGRDGFAQRVAYHRDLATRVYQQAQAHPRLEALHEPELSIACFRYVGERSGGEKSDESAGFEGLGGDLDLVNQRILTRLRSDGVFAPSATQVRGQFAIRPCFITPWVDEQAADGLVEAVVAAGDQLAGAA